MMMGLLLVLLAAMQAQAPPPQRPAELDKLQIFVGAWNATIGSEPSGVARITIGQQATLRFPALNQRTTPEITGEVADPSGLLSLELSVDGAAPVALEPAGPFTYSLDTTTLADGAHLVTVAAIDGAQLANRASASLAFASDNSPPALELAQRSLNGAQGAVLPVFVRATELLQAPKVRFLDQEYPLYAVSATVYRALIGVSVKQEPGTFPLTVEAAGYLIAEHRTLVILAGQPTAVQVQMSAVQGETITVTAEPPGPETGVAAVPVLTIRRQELDATPNARDPWSVAEVSGVVPLVLHG